VVLPLSSSGLLTGVVLTFAHTLGEFGVVLMVGGNIPGVTRTVSISIYDNVQALDYSSAGQTSLVLLVASFRDSFSGVCDQPTQLERLAAHVKLSSSSTVCGPFC